MEDQARKGYTRTSEAWYAGAVMPALKKAGEVDDVVVGVYYDEGGTEGEFRIVWHDLESGKPPVPKLAVFDDAWWMLTRISSDLVGWLGDQKEGTVTPECLVEALDELGYEDMTERSRS